MSPWSCLGRRVGRRYPLRYCIRTQRKPGETGPTLIHSHGGTETPPAADPRVFWWRLTLGWWWAVLVPTSTSIIAKRLSAPHSFAALGRDGSDSVIRLCWLDVRLARKRT